MQQITQPISGTDILSAGTAEINRWVNENPGKSLQATATRFTDSELSGAILNGANFTGTDFQSVKFVGAKFNRAILKGTRFIDCDLRRASFRAVDLSSAELTNCTLDDADFRQSSSFSQIRSLQTCNLVDRNRDVHFDVELCRFLDRYLGWGKIRAVGQLRLFLPSYVALLMSIVTLSFLALVNIQIEYVHDAIRFLLVRNVIEVDLALKLVNASQPIEPSWRHFAVLASTLALAVGSTLYLFCPTRVKEFNLDQWRYIAGRPSFEYLALCWPYPGTRLSCAAAYSIGAGLALLLLGDTLVRLLVLLANGLR